MACRGLSPDTAIVPDATFHVGRPSVGIRRGTARWLRTLLQIAERGEDAEAIVLVLAAVGTFVSVVVAVVMGIALYLYFTIR